MELRDPGHWERDTGRVDDLRGSIGCAMKSRGWRPQGAQRTTGSGVIATMVWEEIHGFSSPGEYERSRSTFTIKWLRDTPKRSRSMSATGEARSTVAGGSRTPGPERSGG